MTYTFFTNRSSFNYETMIYSRCRWKYKYPPTAFTLCVDHKLNVSTKGNVDRCLQRYAHVPFSSINQQSRQLRTKPSYDITTAEQQTTS